MCKVQLFLGQIPVYLMHSEVLIFLMHLWVAEWDKTIQLFIWKDAKPGIFFFERKMLKLPLLSEFISIENVK